MSSEQEYAALGRALAAILEPMVQSAVERAIARAMVQSTPTQPYAVSPAEAAALIGLSRRAFYSRVMPFVYSGIIRSAKIGRLRRIDVESLRAWWQKQIEETAS